MINWERRRPLPPPRPLPLPPPFPKPLAPPWPLPLPLLPSVGPPPQSPKLRPVVVMLCGGGSSYVGDGLFWGHARFQDLWSRVKGGRGQKGKWSVWISCAIVTWSHCLGKTTRVFSRRYMLCVTAAVSAGSWKDRPSRLSFFVVYSYSVTCSAGISLLTINVESV